MRCPKCQYISFETGDRCRNCGYEFSFATGGAELDLPLKTGDEPVGPLTDFALDDVDGLNPGSRATPSATPAASGRTGGSLELPLFRDRARDDDAPLVSLPASPRPPVAVRKSNPAPARPAAARPPAPREPELALDFPEEPEPPPRPLPPREPAAAEPSGDLTAAPGERLLAAAIDGGLMLAIDGVVLFFTLKVTGLTFAEVDAVPILPFLAFLALLNGGYLAGFTAAGGQTIGKMAAGIKVITSDPDAWTDRVPLGQAVLRAAALALSALPLGLGFVPALFGAERRAFHDRLAHTRVVKA